MRIHIEDTKSLCSHGVGLLRIFYLYSTLQYFPLKQPLWVPPGATVNCSIWRRSDESRVWYEWCADVVDTTHSSNGTLLAASSIHNPGGRSSYVKK